MSERIGQAAVEDAVVAANAAREQREAITTRSNSFEVKQLNDMAEVAIFGTGGKTAGFVDPETGDPLTAPIKGKVEEIRENVVQVGAVKPGALSPTKQAEANADKYKRDVLDLVDEGFELCQAKLIMDEREARANAPDDRARMRKKLIKSHIDKGLSGAEAEAEADKSMSTLTPKAKLSPLEERNLLHDRVEQIKTKEFDRPSATLLAQDRLDKYTGPALSAAEKRTRLNSYIKDIMTNGVSDKEAYKIAKETIDQGNSPDSIEKKADDDFKKLIRDNGIFSADDLNKATTKPLTPAEAQRLQAVEAAVHNAATDVVAARNEYARLAAGRDRRAVTRGEFSQDSVAEAKTNYDRAVRELAQAELELLHERGMADAQLRQVVNISAVRFATMLSNELFAERMKATGRYEDGPNGLGDVSEISSRRNRLAGRFYDFWNRQKGVKGAVVKGATVAGIGIIAGIPAALAGTVLLGPIAGGALGATVATKITKGYAAARINRNAGAEVNAEVSSRELDEATRRLAADATTSGNLLDISTITNVSQDQVAERVTRNRRRLALATTIGAIAGGASAYLLEDVVGGKASAQSENSVGAGGAGLLGQGVAEAADLTPESPDDGNGTGGALAGEGSSDSDTSTSTAASETVASKTLDLERGENIWGELSQYMANQGIQTTGPDGLVNIDAAKDAVLEANGLTEEEATKLPVGYKFKIPTEVIEGLKKS